jgi:hypothetical protein
LNIVAAQGGNWQNPVVPPLFLCYNTKRYGVKMTIKLLLLKSGEDLIADVQEMVAGEGDERRVIGYLLNKPCIVKMRNPNVLSEQNVEEQKKTAFEVALYPWMPLSADKVIPVPADWVVTIVEPAAKLTEMYTEDVINYGKDNQSNSTDESTDSNQSD